MSSSSSMQQVQCPCAKSNSFEGHKSSSSSTTACRRESSTRRSLLLRVCVHRQSQITHQQLLQSAGFLPRVHRIETEAAIRAPGEFPGGHTEKLWREFFVDPSHWWDHRPEKVLCTGGLVSVCWRMEMKYEDGEDK